MAIRNIVFDIGNVLVTWNPHGIIKNAFPTHTDPEEFVQKVFRTGFRYDLNAGKISENEAVEKYHQSFNLSKERFTSFIQEVKESLSPLEKSILLAKKLDEASFPLYIISDNTKEIMQFLRDKYNFWDIFQGIVISADIGHLKPSPVIYQHLLNSYQLNPEETVFFDDLAANVEGAKAMKMHSFQFTDADQCIEDLNSLGIKISL